VSKEKHKKYDPYVCVCVCVCTYINIYIHMNIYIYIYIYIYENMTLANHMSIVPGGPARCKKRPTKCPRRPTMEQKRATITLGIPADRTSSVKRGLLSVKRALLSVKRGLQLLILACLKEAY